MAEEAADLQDAGATATRAAPACACCSRRVATLLGLGGLTYLLTPAGPGAGPGCCAASAGVVETLQHSLLPERLPQVPGVDLAVRYLPSAVGAQVGGDWYDVVQLPGGEVGLVMGDVVGHDLHAATEMGQLRSALRAYAAEGLPPRGGPAPAEPAVRRCRSRRRWRRCCTPCSTRCGARVRVANAGHCPPVVRAGEECYLLEQPAFPPIGAVHEVAYTSVEHVLPPDCLLVLYTDGLVERRGESLEDGHRPAVRGGGAVRRSRSSSAAARWSSSMLDGQPREDDMALMLVAPHARLGTHLDLQWEASMDRLALLRRLLERWLAEVGADEDESFDIVLSLRRSGHQRGRARLRSEPCPVPDHVRRDRRLRDGDDPGLGQVAGAARQRPRPGADAHPRPDGRGHGSTTARTARRSACASASPGRRGRDPGARAVPRRPGPPGGRPDRRGRRVQRRRPRRAHLARGGQRGAEPGARPVRGDLPRQQRHPAGLPAVAGAAQPAAGPAPGRPGRVARPAPARPVRRRRGRPASSPTQPHCPSSTWRGHDRPVCTGVRDRRARVVRRGHGAGRHRRERRPRVPGRPHRRRRDRQAADPRGPRAT